MKNLFIAFLLSGIVSFANAQQQTTEKSSHYKAAEEMVQTLGMQKMVDEGMSQMVEMQLKASPILESKKTAMMTFFKKYMSWDVIKEDYIKIYMEEFTEKELKDISAFYRTTTGKKMADRQMAIMMKGSELGQKKVQAHMDELMELIKEGN